jgi:hypothetical protein
MKKEDDFRRKCQAMREAMPPEYQQARAAAYNLMTLGYALTRRIGTMTNAQWAQLDAMQRNSIVQQDLITILTAVNRLDDTALRALLSHVTND